MTFPVSALFGLTNLDAGTDDPGLARADLYTALTQLAEIIASQNAASGVLILDATGKILTSFLPVVPVTLGGTGATNVADARAALGVDAALGYTPVNKAGDTMSGALAVSDGTDSAKLLKGYIEFDRPSTGIAYIDQRDVGGFLQFRVSEAAPVDKAALTLDPDGDVNLAQKLGIGGSPGKELDIYKTKAGLYVVQRVRNLDTGNTASGVILHLCASNTDTAFGPYFMTDRSGAGAVNNSLYVCIGDGVAAYGAASRIAMAIAQNTLNVGIGTVTPDERLTVNGNVKATGNIIAEGDVGIKNASPTSALHINAGSFAGTAPSDLTLAGSSPQMSVGASGQAGKILFARGSDGNNVFGSCGFQGAASANTPFGLVFGGGVGELKLEATAAGANIALHQGGAERMRVHSNGYVGIKNASPAETLDVGGSIKATGEVKGAPRVVPFASGSGIINGSASAWGAINGVTMTAAKGLTMARVGSLTELSLNYDVNVTGSGVTSLSVNVLVDGSIVWTVALDGATGTHESYATQARGTDSFLPGATVSIQFTATGGGPSDYVTLTNLIGTLGFYYDT